MAKKDVDRYFKQIESQYFEMVKAIKDFEEVTKNEMVSPEKIASLNTYANKLKENYMRWSYMMYLLNLPNRKEKQEKFEKANKSKLNTIPNEHKIDGVIEENNDSIYGIKYGL